jgi:hypothetical protein
VLPGFSSVLRAPESLAGKRVGHGRCSIYGVSAEQLMVDPVSAAHRLLGATLIGRDVSAVVVEVDAYGGMPDGPWPDAASHGYRGLTPRNAVTFGPPRATLMSTSVTGSMYAQMFRAAPTGRLPRSCCVGLQSRRVSMLPSSAGAMRSTASHWPVARVTCALL